MNQQSVVIQKSDKSVEEIDSFRQEITSIIEDIPSNFYKLDVEKKKEVLINQVTDIEKLGIVTTKDERYDINAHAFSLGILESESESFRDHNIIFQGFIISSKWLERNMISKIQDIPESEVCEGDIVIYNGIVKTGVFGGSEKFGITHSGIITSEGKIRSKWGAIPAIFEHKLDAVPKGYGKIEEVQYYSKEDIATIKKDYLNKHNDSNK